MNLRNKMDNILSNFPCLDTKDFSRLLSNTWQVEEEDLNIPLLLISTRNFLENHFSEAHNASADVEATTRCFLELIRLEVISKKSCLTEDEFEYFKELNPKPFSFLGLDTQPYAFPLNQEDEKIVVESESPSQSLKKHNIDV